MKLFDKFYYKPIFGLFYLSGIERIINVFMILSIGAFIGADSIDLLSKIKPIEQLGIWYVVPFLILSYVILEPMVSLKSSIKEKNFSYFVVNVLSVLVVMTIFEFIYKFLLLVFLNYFFGQ